MLNKFLQITYVYVFIMEINPLCIILVKSDSKGDRMLFRYPHSTNHQRDCNQRTKRKNPYALIISDDSFQVFAKINKNLLNFLYLYFF